MENKKINWYPGHMFKAKKEVQASLKSIDMVIEIVDARCPISSHNEMLEEITNKKLKLIVFSKCDLVEAGQLTKYIKHFENLGYKTLAVNVHDNSTKKKIVKQVEQLNEDLLKKFNKKEMHKTLRIMIIGMPNVGKSSLINNLANKKKVEVANRPGVTKVQQVIKISENIEVVDTPGILIPKIHRLEQGYNLVLNSLIKDEVVEMEDIAFYLLKYLITYKRDEIFERYSNLKNVKSFDFEDIYNIEKIYMQIGKSCGLTSKNDEVDYEKISRRLVNDYRKQKFGKIILDKINYD